jgi:O-antigen/teichoic acid export membrane protein
MASIKKKFVSGVIWETVGRFSALGIQFFVTILIARILLPSQFGVIGLLTVFIALGQILLDSGFSQALIQKKDASKVDLSSVYFLNMLVGLLIYIILFIASPFIASFYDLPELTAYARVIFLIIPINSFGLIQNVIIQKELDFKKTATANVVSAIFSGIVGVSLAYSGFGIWALVWQQVSLNASKTLLFVIQRRWIPRFVLSMISVKEMFAFSMNLMFHSIVNVTMKNIYVLVIGKFYPVSQVGYYTQADKFQEISASTLSSIVIKVSFPALVHKKDEPEYLRLAYSKIFSTTVFIIAPLMIFLMLIGEPLFRLLLTDKWLPAVPYFKILCIYGMVLPTIQISYNLYKLFKKGKMLLIIDSLRHLLVIASIFFTIRFSISDMLIGLVLCTIIMTLVNLYKSGQLISLSLFAQLKSLLPYYIIGGAIGFVLSFLPHLSSDLLSIGLFAVLFWPIYVIIAAILKLEGYIELKNIMRSLIKKVV